MSFFKVRKRYVIVFVWSEIWAFERALLVIAGLLNVVKGMGDENVLVIFVLQKVDMA